jgi:hypothetical protein
MITLEQSDYFDCFKNMMSLFYFAGVSEEKIPNMSFDQFVDKCTDMPTLQKLRNLIIRKPKLVPEFLSLNRHLITPDDIKIIKDFTRRKTSIFAVLKYEEDYAVFVDTKGCSFYAVKALTEPFSAVLPALPTCIEASLLPFRNRIVWDGIAHVSKAKFTELDALSAICDEEIKKRGLIKYF